MQILIIVPSGKLFKHVGLPEHCHGCRLVSKSAYLVNLCSSIQAFKTTGRPSPNNSIAWLYEVPKYAHLYNCSSI